MKHVVHVQSVQNDALKKGLAVKTRQPILGPMNGVGHAFQALQTGIFWAGFHNEGLGLKALLLQGPRSNDDRRPRPPNGRRPPTGL